VAQAAPNREIVPGRVHVAIVEKGFYVVECLRPSAIEKDDPHTFALLHFKGIRRIVPAPKNSFVELVPAQKVEGRHENRQPVSAEKHIREM